MLLKLKFRLSSSHPQFINILLSVQCCFAPAAAGKTIRVQSTTRMQKCQSAKKVWCIEIENIVSNTY